MLAYLEASPSPYHAVAASAELLASVGALELSEADAWPAGPGAFFLRRGGALVAWLVPEGVRAVDGFRVVAAHTDSPNLRLRPRPELGREGLRQLAVEPYGGVLRNSWLGRDLGVSGRLALRRGGPEVLVRLDEPVCHLAQLAIHLDREVNERGLVLNPHGQLDPIMGLDEAGPGEVVSGEVVAVLAARAGVDAAEVVAFDLMLHDLNPPRLVGPAGQLFASGRLDNLCSAYLATAALASLAGGTTRASDAPMVAVAVLFDHEEVGSTSAEGAQGTLLSSVLERVVLGLGGGREELFRALARTVVASLDMTHATHPNYPERHDPAHPVRLGGGPVVKVNADRRYATDPAGTATFAAACAAAGVPLQTFVNRADLPCGSTVGPFLAARLGVTTVDVGLGQLAMHAARELAGAADPPMMAAALGAFLAP